MNLQLFAHPTSASTMASDYNQGVSEVTQEDYCGPQIELGVAPQVCAQRDSRYQRRTQGKGQKMVQRWQNG